MFLLGWMCYHIMHSLHYSTWLWSVTSQSLKSTHTVTVWNSDCQSHYCVCLCVCAYVFVYSVWTLFIEHYGVCSYFLGMCVSLRRSLLEVYTWLYMNVNQTCMVAFMCAHRLCCIRAKVLLRLDSSWHMHMHEIHMDDAVLHVWSTVLSEIWTPCTV